MLATDYRELKIDVDRLTAENARLSEKLEASRALFSTVIQTAKLEAEIARQQEANVRLMDDWQRMRDALAEQGREAARLYGQATEREVANLRRADAAEAALADRDATIARLTAEWERECADGDRVLIGLGFSPETGRPEGGSLHLGRHPRRVRDP